MKILSFLLLFAPCIHAAEIRPETAIAKNFFNLNFEEPFVLQSFALDALNASEQKLDIDLLTEKLQASLQEEAMQERILAAYSCLSEPDLQDLAALMGNPTYQKLRAKSREIGNAITEVILQKADEILKEWGEIPEQTADILELTPENFCTQVLLSSRPVIVDCSSKQCFPCLAMNPIFEALHKKYGDQIQFAKIDCHTHAELARLFQVTSLPTLLFLKPGPRFPLLVKEIIGKITHQEFESELLQLIQANKG